ncbi:hypothetical protein BST61_g1476 [Cercospora zeina]
MAALAVARASTGTEGATGLTFEATAEALHPLKSSSKSFFSFLLMTFWWTRECRATGKLPSKAQFACNVTSKALFLAPLKDSGVAPSSPDQPRDLICNPHVSCTFTRHTGFR